MAISVFELFKIGIGPSSSHTVGPMRAARLFLDRLKEQADINKVASVTTRLYGSLAATGKGHGSDKAVILGLMGQEPESVDPDLVEGFISMVRESQSLLLDGRHSIVFEEKKHLLMQRRERLPYHTNGMRFCARDEADNVLLEYVYYSVGGGFVIDEKATESVEFIEETTPQPYPFNTADELLLLCQTHNMSISDLMFENEKVWHTEAVIRSELLTIWNAMQACVRRGCATDGTLPGGLNLKRRAPKMFAQLKDEWASGDPGLPLAPMDWVNLFALAVNEENAAGGRVVTAPTNGAAGIIPAVMHYYRDFCINEAQDIKDFDDHFVRFLLTAAAIGILFKKNASISGAEVGCQGEVGSACAMAAGALTELLGGSPAQCENAAEIGIEHNLGLTCDPIAGLVQVPCIERNAMGAVKAINASRIALRGDGTHFVSLDKAIKTMRDTGRDMKDKYKETARGGLAVNVIGVPVNIVDC